jgi:hypothetical protein
VVAGAEQRARGIAADETGPPGDGDAHLLDPPLLTRRGGYENAARR